MGFYMQIFHGAHLSKETKVMTTELKAQTQNL